MATYIIGGALLLIVAAIVWKMAADRKKGKPHCGYNCPGCTAGCPSARKK